MKKPIVSNCMVSHAILLPDTELLSFNGLAWSNVYGMVHQSTKTEQSDTEQWLGNQE